MLESLTREFSKMFCFPASAPCRTCSPPLPLQSVQSHFPFPGQSTAWGSGWHVPAWSSPLSHLSFFFLMKKKQLCWHTGVVNTNLALTRPRIPGSYWLFFSQQFNTCLGSRQTRQCLYLRSIFSLRMDYVIEYYFFVCVTFKLEQEMKHLLTGVQSPCTSLCFVPLFYSCFPNF